MAAEPTRINFFRHGESISNAGAATSDPASIPLTDCGRNQAEQIAQSYEARPTLIVVSSYQRTWQTAAPVIARFPEVPVEEWPVPGAEPLHGHDRCRAPRLGRALLEVV